MSHHKHHDPVRSADRIEDPDQPATLHGEDRAAGSHIAHADATHGTPDEPATTGTLDAQDVTGEDAARAAERDGKAPKVVGETGFPKVDQEVLEAQAGRDVDTSAHAESRKFQPPAERAEHNASAHEPLIVEQGAQDTRGASTGREIPLSEPVEHSAMVEERIQQQEHDYDLGQTEDGERFLVPRETDTDER